MQNITLNERTNIIKENWKLIHNNFVPMFRWRNNENMRYNYNEINGNIECDCGISISIDLPTIQINKITLKELIRKLEYKVYRTFKDNYNIDLGIDD